MTASDARSDAREESHQGLDRVRGKVAIVTGAGSGIGRATAQMLAREGASICVADINAEAARATAEAIGATGGRAIEVRCDVSDENAVAAMIETTRATFGRLDILHNNAAALGTTGPGEDNDITELDVTVWDRAMAVNLRGVMLGCKHAIPLMLESGGGSIINTSSGSASGGDFSGPAYAASKAGGEHVYPLRRDAVRQTGHPLQRRPPGLDHHRGLAAGST